MSEYQNQDSLRLLLGGDSQESGALGRVFESSNTGTLLFDEIEKAHPRILDVFLQVLDAARVTTANGELLDFSGFYIVFTSNLGASELIHVQHSSFATMERHVLARAQQAMRPELYARINEKLVFNRLSYDVQVQIADDLLQREMDFLRSKGHELVADDTVLSFLVRRGFHLRLGARPMRDVVERLIGDAVAEGLLQGGGGNGRLVVNDGENRLILIERAAVHP